MGVIELSSLVFLDNQRQETLTLALLLIRRDSFSSIIDDLWRLCNSFDRELAKIFYALIVTRHNLLLFLDFLIIFNLAGINLYFICTFFLSIWFFFCVLAAKNDINVKWYKVRSGFEFHFHWTDTVCAVHNPIMPLVVLPSLYGTLNLASGCLRIWNGSYSFSFHQSFIAFDVINRDLVRIDWCARE